jgi:hypothetical protein
MGKIMLLTLLIFFLISNAWSQMVLRIDDASYCSGTVDNVLTISLENDENVDVLYFDLRFDPECFTIDPVSLAKTERTEGLDIFQASNPDPDFIKFAATGIGSFIPLGSGPIVRFSVDVAAECDVGQYTIALSVPMLTDEYWPDYSFDVVDGSITIGTSDFEVTLSLDDRAVLQNSRENKITLNLENTLQITAYQTDVLFDTTCFEVVAVIRTGRNPFDIFNWSKIDGGIRILNTGVGTFLPEGHHVVAEIFTDVADCPEGSYTWDVCNSVAADPAACCSPSIKEYDGTITIVTGTKGDVNDDGTIDVRDAVLCVNHILGLWPFEDPKRTWAADCNGPPGNCDGDGTTDALDALKIVNMILEFDECLPWNVIYFNSFESAEDTHGWIGLSTKMFIDDPAPGCGRKSLHIGGGAASMQPIAIFDFPPQSREGYYTMSCWGKSMNYGSIVLTTMSDWTGENSIELYIENPEWKLYSTEESVFCAKNQRLQIGIIVYGYFSGHSIFVDCLKVERLE